MLGVGRAHLSGCVALVSLFVIHADLPAQQAVTLNVRVEEQGSRVPVAGATVRLIGTASRLTDKDGRVRFSGLSVGRHNLAVRALGHAPLEQVLVITADTSITVTLRASAIPLDTITVRPRTFRLIAEILGRDTRRAVPDADISIAGIVDRTNGVGVFDTRRLSANDSLIIEIRAIGYLPAAIPLFASRDTTMRLYLDPDPVAQAMIRYQLKRLDNRVNAVAAPVRRLNRADITRHAAGSLLDALHLLSVEVSRASCLVVDGRVIPLYSARGRERPPDGMEYLYRYVPAEIERVDVINNGQMIRVYTYSYVRRELPKIEVLPTVISRVCN